MPAGLIPSFLFYSYINGITPGPANLCSLSAALRYGKQAALRQWRGLFVGFALDALMAVILNYFVGSVVGQYVKYFSYVGFAYLLWLAIKMLRHSISDEAAGGEECNFLSGLLVQLTNPKVILFCITALGVYVLPYSGSLRDLLFVGLFLPFTGPVCNLAWIFAGSGLRKFFLKYQKQVNVVMAVSLILCAVSLIV